MPSRRKVIKGARWLLLRNRENVEAKDRVRLRDLLHANRRLATVYILKDDLKHLWAYTYVGAAERFFTEWYQRAIRSRIEPLKTFAPSQSARERDPSALSLPTAHQPTRRHQQQDQGPQAHGLWLSGRWLLLSHRSWTRFLAFPVLPDEPFIYPFCRMS